MTVNHTTMTGPKSPADRRRALALEREEADQDGHGQEHEVASTPGTATSMPSTAESTEIAGVIIPSP